MYSICSIKILFLLGITASRAVIAKLITNCKCGVDMSFGDRIIGGEVVLVDKYPWMIYIEFTSTRFCGGTLINDLYVISADHCVSSVIHLNFSLYQHTNNRRKDKGIKYRPVEIIRFKNHSKDPYGRNDVALIKLNKRISYDSGVVPICLPDSDSVYTHLQVSALGWGISDSWTPSDDLRAAQLTVMSDKYCRNSSIGKHYNPDTMLCAYGKRKDSCQGDSGGPLIYNPSVNAPPKYELVGIVSWGVKCGNQLPGVYSKISKYIKWIQEHTEDADYCSY